MTLDGGYRDSSAQGHVLWGLRYHYHDDDDDDRGGGGGGCQDDDVDNVDENCI